MTGLADAYGAAVGLDPGGAGGGCFDGPPVPLTARNAPPPFPLDALPPVVAAMVAAVAEATQVDPGMAGVSALGVLAACAGGRAELEVRRGWREPLNLFTVTVARPGERKSAVQSIMTRPLADAERALAEAGRVLRVEAETARDVARRAAEQAKAAAGRASSAHHDGLLAAAVGAAAQAEAVEVPAVPRIIADDVTAEAAASLLAEQSGRLAVISAEGGVFDTLAGRYSGNVPHLDVWLKGHAGDPLRVDRKGRPPEYVLRPALTLALMVQPTVLEQLAKQELFRGRGLLARILYALPPCRVGRRKIGPEPVPEPVAEGWSALVRGLAQTLAGWTDPAVLTLDAPAGRAMLDLERRLEPLLAPHGELGAIADWGAKLAGAVARLAGLLHLAEHPDDGWRRPVGVRSVDRAARLGDYFTGHALAAFAAMRVDPLIGEAEHVLDVLARTGRHTVSTRDIFSAVARSRFPKTGDLAPVLDLLADHGHLMRLPEPEREGPGRRPSPRWAVHPAISALSAEWQPPPGCADTADTAGTYGATP